MIIKYKNTFGKEITSQQAEQLNEVIQQYIEDNGLISREERIIDGQVSEEFVHNWNNVDHQQLINTYPEAMIIDHKSYVNGYRLEIMTSYKHDGTIYVHSHSLYDSLNNLVAHEVIWDEDGEITSKFKNYWDLEVSPDFELFSTVYYSPLALV